MTANDSDVSDGDILTGSQVVRVYGENLTSPFVTLTFGGVEYTPLAQGEGYIEFIIGDNGVATISVDDSPFMSFEVEGIVVPSFVPTTFKAFQKKDTGLYTQQGTFINELHASDVNCINYPRITDGEYPYFLFLIYPVDDLTEGLEFHNCTINNIGFGSSTMRMSVSVTNSNEVAYISYQGFIIAVFNYTTD